MFPSEVTSCQFGVWETIQLHRSYCNRLHLRTRPYTCSEVAVPFLFDYRLIHAVWFCMIQHCHSSCVMPALLLTIWGFGFISKLGLKSTSLTSNCRKYKSYCKISDLGSNVCDLICLILFVFTNVHARLDACLRVWGPFNLSLIRIILLEIWSAQLVQLDHSLFMDSIAPLIYFAYFLQCNLF